MKVIFCIPALDGSVKARCHQSLVATYQLLQRVNIPYEEFFVENCPCLPTARNTLVAMFLADAEATDLFFIDSDLGFDASAVLKILQRPEEIVSGVYPLKRDAIGWPVAIKKMDGIPIGREGLIEADFLPAGFMRIKRQVFESLAKAYPLLKYADSVVEVIGVAISEAYDFFHMGIEPGGQRWTTEDYAFCRRWRDLGGQLWVYPDVEFQHVGSKAYAGNYHRFLLRQPGGAYSNLQLSRALSIEGWMTPVELEWLAGQAANHHKIVELGSYLGRSTRVLADNTPGHIIAIDHWEGPSDAILSEEFRAQIYDHFCENLSDHLTSRKVLALRCDHKDNPLLMTPGQRPDMVFVDGDHAYESVKRDIRNWKEAIQPGGLLCGHDLDRPEVQRAVRELLPGAESVSGTSLWSWEAPRVNQEHLVPETLIAMGGTSVA